MLRLRFALAALFLCIQCTGQQSVSGSFYADAPDARIAIDVTPFHSSLWNLVQGWYGGRYDINATICNNPPFSVKISEAPDLTAAGWFFPFDGRHGSNLGLSTKFYAHVDDPSPLCQPNATVECSLSACFDPSSLKTDVVHFPGQCLIVGIQDFKWPFVIDLPMPWQSPELPYVLQQPTSQPPNELRLEFGEFKKGKWVPSGTKKIIPFVARFGSVEPNVSRGATRTNEPRLRTDNPSWAPSVDGSPASAVTNKYVFLDVSFGNRFRKVGFDTFAAANAAHSQVAIWDPTQSVGITIAPTLFADPQNPKDDVGIFGNLLPIRIFGKQEYVFGGSQGMIGYELFVTKAIVKFSKKASGDTTISFTAEKIRAWIIQPEGTVERAEAPPSLTVKLQAILGSPTLSPDGTLAVKVKRFTLYLKTWVGSIPFELSRNDLATSLNNGLAELSRLHPSFALELPDCIDTSLDKITPMKPCKVTGASPRYVKFMTPDKNRLFTLLIDKAKFKTQGGNLQIGIPMSVGQLP